MGTISITSADSGQLHTLTSNGDPGPALPCLVLTYAPLWAPKLTSHVHRIPLMGIADVQQTYGYADPMEALQHLVLDTNVHALRQPKDASEVGAYMRDKSRMVKAKLDLWSATEAMLVAEARTARLAPPQEMIMAVASILHPQTTARASRANKLAAPAASLRATALSMHTSFFAKHDVDTTTDGYQRLAGLVAERAEEIAPLMHLNYHLRYGRQVEFAVEQRIREEQGRWVHPTSDEQPRTGAGPQWNKSTWQDPPPLPTSEPEPERPYDPGVGALS